MPISPQQAADIAHRLGLSLADIPAIQFLSDDVAEAEAIAERFRPAPVHVADSIHRKSQQLADLQRRADANGRIAPPGASPAPQAPATPTPAPTPRPVEDLLPGALPADTGTPTRAQQIAQAEQAGDWQTAAALKGQWLDELRTQQANQ